MPIYSINDMPDHARVWVYQSDRKLSDEEVNGINDAGKHFIQTWASHGSNLVAAFEVIHHLFLVLVVDEDQAAASGCSIDKSVAFVQDMENQHGISLFNREMVAYRSDDKIQTIGIKEFEKMLSKGELSENTIVFNNLVTSKKDYSGSWEVKVKDSWHRRLLASV